MEIELNERVISRATDPDGEKKLITKEEIFAHYNDLKNRLKTNIKKKIFYKVESIRILKEIKDNEYYKLDGYKSFDAFIKDYQLARTQVYIYLKLAKALQAGILNEDYIIENGIYNSLDKIESQETPIVKKSKQNPIKPLRFQLKKQESYDFYKSNAKFTGFMLDKLFSDGKEIIKKLMKEYKELKG
ncbi:chromosome replication/partitioning protein [Borreliella burgdorferi]|uniref:Putative plasmid partition protein n=2 Tax=Borreliella burgdorferi TaxID=139 RepID=A0A7U3YB65_BORBG|nr:chromosome replication/partitioning protein [Borreliella burgdorferi]ACM10400.1 putative plasmid partition protein [Borreliella burgdorferi 72a]ACN55343.1 putative plasmid partition protein [Borreliella burgdorferi WI91-23]ACN56000.1 putative plasmid partition protein [Borreliella burgdorferi CA-11.2A]ACN92378.1 putative plasmid partition protein [Borreliella burgdorferi 94a]ACN92856.1 putative plasmid partition protein [Borreliella burgdorferi 118a]